MRTKARLATATAIRSARRASGLTQVALGKRLGLLGRAVYRWERADSVPSRRNLRALVTAIQAVNHPAAVRLAAALANAKATAGRPVAAMAVSSPVPAATTLELAMFGLAEDLELAPRRVRAALLPFFKRMRAGNLQLDAAERLLEGMLAPAPQAAPPGA